MESQDLTKNIDFIHKTMQSSRIYWNLKNILFEQLKDSKRDSSQWGKDLVDIAIKNRVEEKLKNLINDVCKRNIKPLPIRLDRNEYINKARTYWAEFVMQNLIQVSNKIIQNITTVNASITNAETNNTGGNGNNGSSIPANSNAPSSNGNIKDNKDNKDNKDGKNKENGSNGSNGIEVQLIPIPHIYDCWFLFTACVNTANYATPHLSNPNISHANSNSTTMFEYSYNQANGQKTLMKCRFDNVRIDELCKSYSDLSPKAKNLINNDDEYDFILEKEKQAETLIEKGMSSELEYFARRGIPVGIRTKFYQRYFGIETTNPKMNKMQKHYKNIQETMAGHKIILDELIKEDAREVLNDDRYFIFDEMLDKVLWTFYRDKEVYEDLAVFTYITLLILNNI